MAPLLIKNAWPSGWVDVLVLVFPGLLALWGWRLVFTGLSRFRHQPWLAGAAIVVILTYMISLFRSPYGGIPWPSAAMEVMRVIVHAGAAIVVASLLNPRQIVTWLFLGLGAFLVVNLGLAGLGVTNDLVAGPRGRPPGTLFDIVDSRLRGLIGWPGPRVLLPLGDPFSASGIVAATCLAVGSIGAVRGPGRWRLVCLPLAILGGLVCVLLDRFGVTMAAVLTIGIGLCTPRRHLVWTIALPILVLIGIGIGAISAAGITRMHDEGQLSHQAYLLLTISHRTQIWSWYLANGLEPQLILGYGFYPHLALGHLAAPMVPEMEDVRGWGLDPHNQLLTTWYAAGWFAMIAMGLMQALLPWKLAHLARSDAAQGAWWALLCVLGIFLVLAGISEETWGINYPATTVCWLLLLAVILIRPGSIPDTRPRSG
jgi:hypothetical protein